MSTSLVSELRNEVIGYLKRERERAKTASHSLERGSTAYVENAARLHEIGTILYVIASIFRQAERALEKDREAEERKEDGSTTLPD